MHDGSARGRSLLVCAPVNRPSLKRSNKQPTPQELGATPQAPPAPEDPVFAPIATKPKKAKKEKKQKQPKAPKEPKGPGRIRRAAGRVRRGLGAPCRPPQEH